MQVETPLPYLLGTKQIGAESGKIGSVFYCSKNIKKILKKYQKTIDKRKLMWYNKTYPKEKEVKKGEIFKSIR